MAGDRRATVGLHDRQPPHREGLRRRRAVGRRDRRCRGPGGRDGAPVPGPAAALREGRGRAALASRARRTSSRRWCGRTCPPRCRASWSCRSSPATTTGRQLGRVFSFDAAGGKYEEADYQANGSGGVHARNWIKAGWREGISADDAIELAIRSLFAAADEDVATGGPDLVRGHLPDGRDHRRRRLPSARRRRRRGPGAGAPRRRRARRQREPGEADSREHAVLRLARTGHEGPGGLRPEGHRPRSQPGGARVRRRRPDRGREPEPHAVQDQRALRPHRVRGRRQVQRVPEPQDRWRPPRRPQGLPVLAGGRHRERHRQRVRADARARSSPTR